MLLSLSITDFAIVKHLELDFREGMTAFTGETGAGKSIMIDALMLALGDRVEPGMIRPGAEKCDITAEFVFEKESETKQWLEEHDIPAEEGCLLLRRVISVEGRSKSTINGQPMPISKVKELGVKLVHIHGQHQHQTLLQHPTHRQQLDQYAKHPELIETVASLYKQHKQIRAEIERVLSKGKQEDRSQWLQFQLEELTALAVAEGEVEQLHETHQMLHHAKDYLLQAEQIQTLLQGDDNFTICSALHRILQALEQLPSEKAEIKNALELINTALIQCEEASDAVRQFSEAISLDPEQLQHVEARLTAIHAMARKYQLDTAALPQQIQHLQQELGALENEEMKLAGLESEASKVAKAYTEAAERLRLSRQKAAEALAQEITASIQQLGMPKGWVAIESTPLESMQPHGMEKIEYQVCTNPGMAPDSLAKVASGGELSRISLAIQMITAEKGLTPTILFDEVDVGIGGATAALVGGMLRQLGERLQVFCVTHQPQVAASAHEHYQVIKHSDNTATHTEVKHLSAEDRIEEVARMLGGVKVTEQTVFHAKELLEHLTA